MRKKGTVGIESISGRLRLRLPRASGSKRYVYLNLSDTKENRRQAKKIANRIQQEINSMAGNPEHYLLKFVF